MTTVLKEIVSPGEMRLELRLIGQWVGYCDGHDGGVASWRLLGGVLLESSFFVLYSEGAQGSVTTVTIVTGRFSTSRTRSVPLLKGLLPRRQPRQW